MSGQLRIKDLPDDRYDLFMETTNRLEEALMPLYLEADSLSISAVMTALSAEMAYAIIHIHPDAHEKTIEDLVGVLKNNIAQLLDFESY